MSRSKTKTENEVIKASAATQINGRITLLQRRAWNVLLANAYEELPTKDRHSMQIANLIDTLEFDSKNDDHLKEALKSLVHCSVEWNLLDKDDQAEWGVSALLAEVKITRGVCTYAYGPTLRERLYNPSMYARLSLLLQNRFESKHALALWELCTDYLGAKRDYGETPWIPLEDFRRLMGVEDSQYYAALFKKLKEKVIKPALAEINQISDFNVTVGYQCIGRKVVALKFKMRRVALLPEPSNTPAQLFPELDDMPQLVRELINAGLSTQDALHIWQQGFGFVEDAARPKDTGEEAEQAFASYVREKIHLLKRRQSSGKVDNSTGFLREAIHKNYANPEYAVVQQRETQRLQQQSRQALAQQQTAVEARREEALQTLCRTLVEEEPQMLEQAVAWALQAAPGFHLLYHREHTALANYCGRLAIQAVLNPLIERQAPDRFAALRERFAVELAALESDWRGLQPE